MRFYYCVLLDLDFLFQLFSVFVPIKGVVQDIALSQVWQLQLLLNSHHSAVKHFSKVIVKNLPPSFGMNSAFSVAEAMQVSENNRQNTAQNFLCNNVVILVSFSRRTNQIIKCRLEGNQRNLHQFPWRFYADEQQIYTAKANRETSRVFFVFLVLSVWIGVAQVKLAYLLNAAGGTR